MVVYLLHSTIPLVRSNGEEVRHYLGFTEEWRLHIRLREHRKGYHTTALVREWLKKGAELQCVRLWPNGGLALEQYLKAQGRLDIHCPLCREKALERRRNESRRYRARLRKQREQQSPELSKPSGGDAPVHSTTTAISRDGRSLHSPLRVRGTLSGDEALYRESGGKSWTAHAEQPPVDASKYASTKQPSSSEEG